MEENQMTPWAVNRSRDRERGERSELRFKDELEKHSSYEVRLNQQNVNGAYKICGYIGPDALIIRDNCPIVWVEIKRKYPTSTCHFGIELYRLADYLKIEELLGLPVYYVIHVDYAEGKKGAEKYVQNCGLSKDIWLWAKFSDLWEKAKENIGIIKQDFLSYDNVKFNGKITDDEILGYISEIRRKEKRIYIEFDEASKFLEACEDEYSQDIALMRLADKSYYSGNRGTKATVVYFPVLWFKKGLNALKSELESTGCLPQARYLLKQLPNSNDSLIKFLERIDVEKMKAKTGEFPFEKTADGSWIVKYGIKITKDGKLEKLW
ncbi:hypothetical protein [Thermococcus sp. LS2]|uniref:hypothetical protein n=1 Tax=Thermococcus sp. LS2 TaxID=1638260 RepID=UPI00143882A2|nr:hypothetical protein [Thermococcus sp. LS2]NJE11823.1 hypothetical protein [Thermococcus sp. LS2]